MVYLRNRLQLYILLFLSSDSVLLLLRLLRLMTLLGVRTLSWRCISGIVGQALHRLQSMARIAFEAIIDVIIGAIILIYILLLASTTIVFTTART